MTYKPSLENKRYCGRCGEPVHGRPEDQPHICADIQKRITRREKQVQAVIDILARPGRSTDARTVAESIVKKLSQLGVTED